MRISNQDADLFFELTWSLQFFVNQKLKILPDIKDLQAYIDCDFKEKMQVRNALYENIDLIDEFTKENPDNFSEDKLAIITQWKNFLAGTFYIERFLKKHAIFISHKDNNVYAVLALYSPFEEMIDSRSLPTLVKTVLLPFKGKIVYDGLFEPYKLIFGRGISSDLKEIYMAAKQNKRIIYSFSTNLQSSETNEYQGSIKELYPEIEEIVAKAKKLRAKSNLPAIISPTFSLARASLEFTQTVASNPDNLDLLWKTLKKVERALSKVENTLNRSESL